MEAVVDGQENHECRTESSVRIISSPISILQSQSNRNVSVVAEWIRENKGDSILEKKK